MNISIIGAGIGGLSSACLLAAKGHQITVFEKNETPGGKMNQVKAEGFQFDTGPSLLTMPFVLEKLFNTCGVSLADYITLVPLHPICRYFYADGTLFSNYKNQEKTLEQIRTFAPEDAEAYAEFLAYAASLYNKTAQAFIFNPLFDFKDLKELNLLNFFGIDAFATVSDRVNRQFKSPYLQQFFKRFTTYNGSSPYLAPATLNVIPDVELNHGGFYVKGGLYKVIEALLKLAKKLDVAFHFNTEIKGILTNKEGATGIQLSTGEKVESDLVISNSDATETTLRLLPDAAIPPRKRKKAANIEPSCSGFVLLLGIDTKYEQLVHHNIFFSDNYEREFEQLFEKKIMPDDPTIYVANTSCSDPDHAPKNGSNLFILVNAPYLSKHYDWEVSEQLYGDKIIRELEKRGLRGLSKHIKFRKSITPVEFYQKYRSNKGSIYGTSSNSMFSAFLRPRNKSREVEKLYYVGGSTHPGGGIPLVIQSAFNAVELIGRYEE
jgi:phytoene desaturase